MKKILITLALLATAVAVLYAQEPVNQERGLNILRGNLTISRGDIVITEDGNGIRATSGDHLILSTAVLSDTVRLNVQTDSTTTSGDLIGFQARPRAGVSGTQTVYGGQISGQVADAVALSSSGSVIGLHTDVYVRGTSAGTIAGDVRALQIELVTDDAATRTISGYIAGIRMRMAFSATTVTGDISALRIESPEAQTNSQTYTQVLTLTNTVSGVWHHTDADSGDTEAGYIKVEVNGADRYIVLYSDAPTL